MNYLGDFLHGQIIDLKWGSNAADGSSVARSTDGNIRIYKGNNVAQRSSSAGITDTEGFDGLTGINHLRIDTADNTDAGFWTSVTSLAYPIADSRMQAP